MKVKISLAVLIFLSVNAFSQPAKIRGGIKAGLTFANSKIEPDNNFPGAARRTSLTGGGFLNIHFGKNLLLQPAAMFVSKGGRNYGGMRVGYLEIPLNILYKTGSGKGVYFFGGGLSPAFNLNGDYYGYYEDIRKFDLGLSVLAGFMVPIGFSINLGYTHGLMNVINEDSYKMRNRYFAITAGYEF